MSEHTPGPWSLNPHDHCLISGQRGAGHSNIANTIVIPAHGVERYAIAEANAHLIAAAPDLLASVQELITGAPADDSAASAVYARARAAIAKAKGESDE